jgi:hypothetical protein
MAPHNPTPNVSSRYGAPMGRTSDHLDGLIIEATDTPFTLRHIHINSGGYDSGGAYWGLGQPLFWWSVEITEGDSRDECSGFLRASNRDAAKAKIKALHPLARFFR